MKFNMKISLKILLLIASVMIIVPISNASGPVPDTREAYISWSPDGQKILFISYGVMSEGLFIVKPDGSELQRIGGGWNPSWSPDGTKIVISENFYNGTDARGGSYEFAQFDLKTKNITRLTYNGNSLAESKPEYSPDGKKIVFDSNGIFIMNSDGTRLEKIVDSASSPAWSPNGKKIAYYTYGDLISIWVINPDGTNKKKIFIDYGRNIYNKFRWTSDSKYLLLNNGSNIITKVNIDNPKDIEYIYDPVAHWNPKYSPDGNFVAFASNMDGGDYDLFVARSNGSDLYRLVYNTNPRVPNPPDYFQKIGRPTPPPWPWHTPEPTPVAAKSNGIPGFSFSAVFASLIVLVMIKRIKL